jgi:hypothetical protein
MTLPASGAISFGDVNTELGLTATAQISLGDAAVRNLFALASGAIDMNTGHGKANWTPVTGTLSGASGTLAIHASQHPSVTVSMTGCGGYGGDNSWYDPGQPYIAPSGYVDGYYSNPGQDAIAPSGWVAGSPAYWTGGTWIFGPYNSTYIPGNYSGLPPFLGIANTTESGTANGTRIYGRAEGIMSGGLWFQIFTDYTYSGATYYAGTSGYYSNPGQAAIAPSGWVGAYYSDPGQSYIAPSSGGGPYSIPTNNMTATVNGSTITWTSGWGNVLGNSSTQTLTAVGGQTLSYANPGGQPLSYSYSY